MINRYIKEPSKLIETTVWVFLLIMIVFVMYIGEGVFIPFILASFLSALLYPMAKWFERVLKFPRSLAIFVVIIFLIAVLSSLSILCYQQLSLFVDDIPLLQDKVNKKLFDLQILITEYTGVRPRRQLAWYDEQITYLIQNSGIYIRYTLGNLGLIFANFGIIIFYIFFMIYYREKFWAFIQKSTPDAHHTRIFSMVKEIKVVIQKYVNGVFIVVVIMSTMISTGLYALGVPFALFLGIMTGILNIIPYIGIIIGGLLALVITFFTMDTNVTLLGVTLVFFFSHALEANFITPKIVGKQVSVNPLITFIALLVGSEIWGIWGMILFIPLIGVMKVIVDNIPAYENIAILLGTETYIPKRKKSDEKKKSKPINE
jgi:predicted PurR-regulated permease PerM